MKGKEGGGFRYTSDTVLRILMCQTIEGLSLREIVIRIDDSHFLRQFVRIYSGPMMDFTTLCKLKNHISPTTWKKVNELLAQYAVQQKLIEGERLRLDTSAVETNIHWPTDSSLLWDSYRVLARLIEAARKLDPQTVGSRRLHPRRARRLAVKISRKSSKNPNTQEALKSLYERLIPLVTSICQTAEAVRQALQEGIAQHRYGIFEEAMANGLAQELAHFRHLALRVIDQSSRRVFDGELVPNEQKIFSVFEAHTELLKRGKAAKPIEFGHMIQIQQVACKFITDYEVFAKKPVEHTLLEASLNSHRQLFGHDPQILAADKGYYEKMEAINELQKKIQVVSIAKKGSRTEEEIRREADPEFRFGQRFRAGIEGTISFLKRVLGLFRCLNKGWEHFVSTVAAAIFTHNVLILARR
jgi:IS5 family transposase